MEIWYINLESRADRDQHMCSQLSFHARHLSYFRLSARSGNNETLLDLYEKDRLSLWDYYRCLSGDTSFITRGSIGCFLSHLELYRRCVETNKVFIILEDDVFLLPGFEDQILHCLDSLDAPFDVIYLGQPMNLWVDKKSDVSPHFWKIQDGYYGTFGYIIHPSYASFLLHHLGNAQIQNHIDNTLLDLNIRHQRTVLLVKNPLVHTDVSPGRNSNVTLDKRARRYKPIYIPQIFHLLRHPFLNDQIRNLCRPNPTFSTKVHESTQEMKEAVDTGGGFFVSPGIHFAYPLKNIIHNIHFFTVQNHTDEVYGKVGSSLDPEKPTLCITERMCIFDTEKGRVKN